MILRNIPSYIHLSDFPKLHEKVLLTVPDFLHCDLHGSKKMNPIRYTLNMLVLT